MFQLFIQIKGQMEHAHVVMMNTVPPAQDQ